MRAGCRYGSGEKSPAALNRAQILQVENASTIAESAYGRPRSLTLAIA
jgi:hypothetical protein